MSAKPPAPSPTRFIAVVALLTIAGCGRKSEPPHDQAGAAREPKPEPERSPIVGNWREVGRFPCNGGPEFVPHDPIREFEVYGGLNVTWTPFESYVDYSAEYELDVEAGTLTITGLNGNYVPPDVDPSGRFEVDGDTIVLRDMWLGSSKSATGPAGCGHRFGG